MSKIGAYHVKALSTEASKIINHIKFLHNEGVLGKISHSNEEDEYTWACIHLKTKTTLDQYRKINENLDGWGLKMI